MTEEPKEEVAMEEKNEKAKAKKAAPKKKKPAKKKAKAKKPVAKKPAKKSKGKLVGGRYRPSSAMATIFSILAAGKAVALKALAKKVKGVNVRARIRTMARHGKAGKTWVLDVSNGKVTLKRKKGKR